jgi:hypothetical protein
VQGIDGSNQTGQSSHPAAAHLRELATSLVTLAPTVGGQSWILVTYRCPSRNPTYRDRRFTSIVA